MGWSETVGYMPYADCKPAQGSLLKKLTAAIGKQCPKLKAVEKPASTNLRCSDGSQDDHGGSLKPAKEIESGKQSLKANSLLLRATRLRSWLKRQDSLAGRIDHRDDIPSVGSNTQLKSSLNTIH